MLQGHVGRGLHDWADGGRNNLRQVLFSETNHQQIISKNTINVKRTNHREAVIVMPGHTTAVKGVVFQDQFVR